MTWNGIRRATTEDYDRIRKTAKDFQEKYFPEMEWDEDMEWLYTEYIIDSWSDEPARHRAIYRKRVSRALREPYATGIAHGMVGYSS